MKPRLLILISVLDASPQSIGQQKHPALAADPKAWIQTIKKVQQCFPQHQYIVAGHQSWQNNQLLEYTLQLIQKYLAGKAK